jgi:large subunit ribosomal protein L24
MERLRKDDIVEVISGVNNGKQGKILKFNAKRTRAYVEKVAMVKKHSKATQQNPSGGIIEKEASLHTSNLMLVDPSTKKPAKTGVKSLKDGKRVRYFKQSGTELK